MNLMIDMNKVEKRLFIVINEKKENIIIYLNNNILCYKNIETLEIVKRIKISNINLNLK